MIWGWIIGAALTALALVLFNQHRTARRVHRPLASRQPPRDPAASRTPLGMEGLDLDAVDRTTRRNEALERSTGGWTSRQVPRSFLAAPSAVTLRQPDDETYAAWFHTAFLKDKSKEKRR